MVDDVAEILEELGHVMFSLNDMESKSINNWWLRFGFGLKTSFFFHISVIIVPDLLQFVQCLAVLHPLCELSTTGQIPVYQSRKKHVMTLFEDVVMA